MTGDSVILELMPENSLATSYNLDELSMEGNIVIRCASCVIGENGLSIETSKSKAMKANYLVFINQAASRDSMSSVEIIIAPINGKEYEYDMTQAALYTITISSAEQVITDYGIPYLDWQDGVCSSSEQFPCCE